MSARPTLVWRLLSRLLPAGFRRRHGSAMEETHVSAAASARAEGRVALLRFLAHEMMDLCRTAIVLRRRDASGAAARAPTRVWAGVLDDLVLAQRSIRRSAGFFGFAVLTLGLGVGATTAMYSALKAVVLEAPRYPGGDRAVTLWRTMSDALSLPLTPAQMQAVAADGVMFDAVATLSYADVTITGLGEPVQLSALRGGPDLAGFMSVRPSVGRMLDADEARSGAHVLLVSYELWRSRFGGRGDIAGATVTVDGEPWRVIGVLPAGVVRPDGMPGAVDVWLPPAGAGSGQLIARLREGITTTAAAERFTALFAADAPSMAVTPAVSLRSASLREPLRILMIAVSLLLLTACVNVSNLLLHRSASRRGEMAVRSAIGATRSRLLRGFMAETLLLSLAGGGIGALIAWAGTSLAAHLRPADLAALQVIRVDRGVLVFSMLCSLAAWLLFSIPSALRASSGSTIALTVRASRRTGTGSARVRWTLVGVEVALSFALLVGAAALIRDVRASAGREIGYEPESFLAVDIDLPAWRYPDAPARQDAFEAMRERIAHIPGVSMTALSVGVPPLWGIRFGEIEVDGAVVGGGTSVLHGGRIDERYLEVIGQRLASGRTFLAGEVRDGANMVVLGESAASMMFPGGNAVGRRFRMNGSDIIVAGVVADIPIVGLGDHDERAIAYWPLGAAELGMHVLVRTDQRDAGMRTTLASIVRAVEPDALVRIDRGSELLGATLARERFSASLLTAFAALALLLSAGGLYGVLSRIVNGRTHELGLRIALGASRRDVAALILKTGALVVMIGMAAGGVLVHFGLILLGSRVFMTAPVTLELYAAAAAALGTTALLAMWSPAARAARVDPVRAMGME